ncbi:malto-oligosyltrehalose trehalohydrolase [uncultured Sphingomonas sp.]|uniref:malto-oligosyltrehalose trehalohydrolase n=1 Tax=uncultured Sphingomonas sp. TaxID=158754 RepID=UPI0035CCA223
MTGAPSTCWGPLVLAEGGVRFRLWAPDRDAVTLEIDGGGPSPMTRTDDDWFAVDAEAAPGTRYRFRLDADTAVPDPAARAQSGGVHGWSVVVDPFGYRWRHDDWVGRPWETMVVLEVHTGLLGGFAGVAERLEGWAALGITAIELMPVGAFGGTRGWGYDGVLPFAPLERYGTPDELRALIDHAHGLGVSVFLDVVYNHFGPDGNYLGAYAAGFFDEEVHTPWGGAVAVDKPPVHRFFAENALMWLGDYRIDGLRFDAVHAIGNDGFLDELATELRAALPGRAVHLVLENEKNDADRLSPDRFDAQWNDDFHNVLHVLLTGEAHSYYTDFAEAPADRLARCLSEGFIYQGQGSPNHDGKPRGKPSGHLPPTRFVSFLQNHDQVGNRALGERLTAMVSEDRLRAATLLLLLAPQIPLLFMGEEEGCDAPFLFFTDFHDELADAVREGRRKEFAGHPGFDDEGARERIPDPNAHGTFERSRPVTGSRGERWRTFYRDLLAIRRERIVPGLADARSAGAEAIGPAAVVARWRLSTGETLTIAINLGDEPVAFPNGEPIASVGTSGAPASAAAWLA